MGEQGGLRTGWLAAFGTEGYEGEPALMEELGVNFAHIKGKVSLSCFPDGWLIYWDLLGGCQNWVVWIERCRIPLRCLASC